jgi:RNA polymerase sigma-70 factor (ECF subfamily)
MDRDALEQHLSQITTAWTMFGAAHGLTPGRADAQAQLLQRYGAPVYRYLLAALRDRDAADELFQEFALRFLRGDFRRAEAAKGRFRDYLKSSLFRLIVDARRRQKRASDVRPLPRDPADLAPLQADEDAGALGAEADRQFLDVWRAELIAAAWDALRASEAATGQPVHAVLKLRGDEPSLKSAEMAERLGAQLGKAVSAGWVRKKLLLAREVFTDALLDAVAQSIPDPTPARIEEELIELGLVDRCRDALARRAAADRR